MSYTTGIQALDVAVGGGFRGGCLVELYGESDAGKTALALRFASRAIRDQRTVAWVATVPPPAAASCRWAELDPDFLLVLPQSPLSPALPGTAHLLQAGVDLVVIDSLTACITTAPEDGLAAALALGLPLVKQALAERPDALVVVTNQLRGIGVKRVEVPSGAGAALSRAVDYRVRLTAGEGIYRGGMLIGRRTTFRVDRTPEPMETWYAEGSFSLYWEEGLKEKGERRGKGANDALSGSEPPDPGNGDRGDD